MVTYMGATEVRKDFLRLADRAKDGDTVAVTKHGKPVLALIPWSMYESMLETASILGDRAMLDSIIAGEASIQAGAAVSLDDLESSPA